VDEAILIDRLRSSDVPVGEGGRREGATGTVGNLLWEGAGPLYQWTACVNVTAAAFQLESPKRDYFQQAHALEVQGRKIRPREVRDFDVGVDPWNGPGMPQLSYHPD
jgi:hypothetical protein